MRITLKVTPNEGQPYEVTTTLKVIVDWERKYKKSINDLPAGKYGLEDLVFFAYQASKLTGIPVPMTLDGYLDQIASVEVAEVEDGNPT